MTKVCSFILLFGLCFAAVGGGHSKDTDYPCKPAKVPLEMIQGSKLKVLSHHFSTGTWAYPGITFRNETGETLWRALVVVDYFDSDGKLIFSIPFLGRVDDAPVQLMELRAYIRTVWGHPIKPGETFPLWGTNLEDTRIVPAFAKATLVDAEFEDGNLVSSNFAKTDPLLLKSPKLFEMHTDIEKLPDEIWLRLQIDDRGRVGNIEFQKTLHLAASDSQQIASQLKLWIFFPATAGGYAVPAELNLRLSFHEKGLSLPRPECPLTLSDRFPRTYVPVEIKRENGDEWEVKYAGQYARGYLDTIVSKILD